MTEATKLLKEHGYENVEELAKAFEKVAKQIWKATYSLIETIKKDMTEEKWAEFIEDYKRVMEDAGDATESNT